MLLLRYFRLYDFVIFGRLKISKCIHIHIFGIGYLGYIWYMVEKVNLCMYVCIFGVNKIDTSHPKF